jgi:hypothetical protein
MACDIGLGRLEPCKDQVGGLDAVYFINYDDLPTTAITLSVNDEITEVTGDPRAYKYDLKGTSNLDQAVTSSRENGTTFFDQVLSLNLKKQDLTTHKEVKLLAHGRPKVIVRDNNGNFFLMGYEHGADVNGGNIVTGSAFGDFTGYNLTLQAMEKAPALFLDATSEAELVSLGFEIVDGNGTITS